MHLWLIKRNKLSLVLSLCITLLFSVNSTARDCRFASIAQLGEQEVARIVLPQIYQKIGKSIHITPLPANRAQFEANSGIKDGEILRIYSYGAENPNVIRVPTPYYSLVTSVFSLKTNHFNITSKDDLKGYRVGRVRGVKHTNNATKNLSMVYDSSDTKQLFQQLLLGNIDVALTNYRDGLLTIEQLGTNQIKVINKEIAFEPLYHYLHVRNKALVPPLDNTIKKLTASGELATMLHLAEEQVY